MKDKNKLWQTVKKFFGFYDIVAPILHVYKDSDHGPAIIQSTKLVGGGMEKELSQKKIDELPVSCLVLGLIKSIKKDHKDWHMKVDSYGRLFCNDIKSNSSYSINFEYNSKIPLDKCLPEYFSSDYKFNKKESLLLREAIDNHQKKIIEEERKKLEKQNKNYTKYFEDLGCPVNKVNNKSKNKKGKNDRAK